MLDGFIVVENGLLWRNISNITDVHMTYPSDGNMHYTVNSQGNFSLRVFSDKTVIACYTASHEPQYMPNFNSIAMFSLPLKMSTRKGHPLNDFPADGFFAFPSSAFLVSGESTTKSFSSRQLKSKYEVIDLDQLEGSTINVHVSLKGADVDRNITDSSHFLVIYSKDIDMNPLLEVVVTASILA